MPLIVVKNEGPLLTEEEFNRFIVPGCACNIGFITPAAEAVVYYNIYAFNDYLETLKEENTSGATKVMFVFRDDDFDIPDEAQLPVMHKGNFIVAFHADSYKKADIARRMKSLFKPSYLNQGRFYSVFNTMDYAAVAMDIYNNTFYKAGVEDAEEKFWVSHMADPYNIDEIDPQQKTIGPRNTTTAFGTWRKSWIENICKPTTQHLPPYPPRYVGPVVPVCTPTPITFFGS